jgi:hypothetical protein
MTLSYHISLTISVAIILHLFTGNNIQTSVITI